MTGTVELDQDGVHLLIRFPYREDLVAMVKELPGRRWDPRQKVWRVPATHVEQVFAACSRHLFEFAPEISSLLAGTLRAAPAPTPREPRHRGEPQQAALPLPASASAAADADPAAAMPALTVSALHATVRDGLRRLFPESFWLVGEIVDFDKSAGRQHRFFQLVEKARHEARAIAAVEVALFASAAERILPQLLRHDPPLELRDGLEVRILVRVDLYAATGRFQVVVQDIDPSFTLGKLALTKEQILRELAGLGLATRNRSLGFPVPALRIGVLTSPDADGWNDFLRHVEEAHVGLELTLVPIKVQGPELRPTLLAGLAWFAAHAADFDVLCIVRGGGSRTDLAWFDDRDVALAVARHPLKVVVGIGHQRDQSVLDAIAHSEKTPTAVAELLVRGIEDARADVQDRARRLQDGVAAELATARERLAATTTALQRATHRRLHGADTALTRAGRDLAAAARYFLLGRRQELQRAAVRASHATGRGLERAAAALDRHATRLRLLDPARVLARGFAIVRSADGRIAPSAAKIRASEPLQVQWRDGRATVHVDVVRLEP